MSRGRPTFTESNRAIVFNPHLTRQKRNRISAGVDNPAFDRTPHREPDI
jgi:hypothetical protein